MKIKICESRQAFEEDSTLHRIDLNWMQRPNKRNMQMHYQFDLMTHL